MFGAFAANGLSPTKLNLLGYPTNYSLVNFAANQNIASSCVLVALHVPFLNVTLPLELFLWMTFNRTGQISQYDVTFRSVGQYLAALYSRAKGPLGTSTTAETKHKLAGILASNICTSHLKHCTGSNAQYRDAEHCADHLLQRTRLGGLEEHGADTLLCRMVHEAMLPYNSSAYCPAVGPDGGGVCVDHASYEDLIEQPYFERAAWIPYGKRP